MSAIKSLSLPAALLNLCLSRASSVLFSSAQASADFRQTLTPELQLQYKELTRSFKDIVKSEMRFLTIESAPSILLDEKIEAMKKVLQVNLEIFEAIENFPMWEIQGDSLDPSLIQAATKLAAAQAEVEQALAELNTGLVAQALTEYECLEYASSNQ